MQASSIKIHNKRGYTLIEVIVVSVIAAMLGFGVVNLLSWMMRDGNDVNQKAHLQSEASVILEDLGRRTRASTKVLVAGGKMVSFLKGGVLTSSVGVVGGQLQENGIAYKVSGVPVLLNGAQSFFIADTLAKTLQVNMVLVRNNIDYTINTVVMRCRN